LLFHELVTTGRRSKHVKASASVDVMRLEFENLASQVTENFRRIRRLEEEVASLRKALERQPSAKRHLGETA